MLSVMSNHQPRWFESAFALIVLVSVLSISCTNTKPPEEPSITIAEKRYRVSKVEHGKMSWYSVKTNFGTATASGEKFTNHGKTAAHKHLKMGTKVRITNLKNGKHTIVRVNDRGPFKPGRIIDVAVGLSHASHLDFHIDGVVPCKVEVLEEISES